MEEMGGACNMHGEIRNAYKIPVIKPEGTRPPTKPRCKWEDNIKMNVTKTEWEGVDWTDLAQESNWWWDPVYTEMNLWAP